MGTPAERMACVSDGGSRAGMRNICSGLWGAARAGRVEVVVGQVRLKKEAGGKSAQ